MESFESQGAEDLRPRMHSKVARDLTHKWKNGAEEGLKMSCTGTRTLAGLTKQSRLPDHFDVLLSVDTK